MTNNSFSARDTLAVGDTTYDVFRLDRVAGTGRLPYSLKVLMENLLRNEDGMLVTADQVNALADWKPAASHGSEIEFTPARVLLQDFTGVPCVVDFVAMRDAMDRHYAIALMTEGCGEAGEMARRLGELMGARVRPSVLGHSQRGSRPSARDRHLGLMCGRAAIDMLATGAGGAVLVSKGVPLVQTVARRPRDARG